MLRLHEMELDAAREIVNGASPEEIELARSLNLLMGQTLLATAQKSKMYALGRAAEDVLPFWPDGGGLCDALEAARSLGSPAYWRAVERLRGGGWSVDELGCELPEAEDG